MCRNRASFGRCRVGLVGGYLAAERRSTLTHTHTQSVRDNERGKSEREKEKQSKRENDSMRVRE